MKTIYCLESFDLGQSQESADFSDNKTVVTYSVQFYYTPQFAAITPDIPGFIDLVVEETNQGYKESDVPVRVKVHCIEAATINDTSSPSTMLSNFQGMKSSLAELKNSADAAALLVANFAACGIAYTYTYSSGLTLSVTMKKCATGYYSFGHELGHNFGCQHNVEAPATNPVFSYGYGYLIGKDTGILGYRTILAYNHPNHTTRVNRYSNPSINYPPTVVNPTGVVNVANNAAVLMRNRFTFAALGNETLACKDSNITTTTTRFV